MLLSRAEKGWAGGLKRNEGLAGALQREEAEH